MGGGATGGGASGGGTFGSGTSDAGASGACRGLPLGRFDTVPLDGVLNAAEARIAAVETVPLLTAALDVRLGCDLSGTQKTGACFDVAGTDRLVQPGREYDAWVDCVLSPLPDHCKHALCAAS